MQTAPLTSEDWLNLALNELRDHGYGALKAQPLARKLGVTRGSFYHHFDSLESFHSALIAHWSRCTTGRVAAAVRMASDPRAALEDLLQRTLGSGEKLERAVRSWSTVAPRVAREVEKVDLERIGVAEDLLLRSGLPAADAAPRARLLYWAAIGRLMLPFPDNNRLSSQEISDLARLMLR